MKAQMLNSVIKSFSLPMGKTKATPPYQQFLVSPY